MIHLSAAHRCRPEAAPDRSNRTRAPRGSLASIRGRAAATAPLLTLALALGLGALAAPCAAAQLAPPATTQQATRPAAPGTAVPAAPSLGRDIVPLAASAPATIGGRPVLRILHVVATAYGTSLKDNYPYGPVDAFGKPLAHGDIAVDPRVIPLGTHLWVTGYHESLLPGGGFLGVARDTGGAIKGNRIDIFLNGSPAQVSNFGVQRVTVYILG